MTNTHQTVFFAKSLPIVVYLKTGLYLSNDTPASLSFFSFQSNRKHIRLECTFLFNISPLQTFNRKKSDIHESLHR